MKCRYCGAEGAEPINQSPEGARYGWIQYGCLDCGRPFVEARSDERL